MLTVKYAWFHASSRPGGSPDRLAITKGGLLGWWGRPPSRGVETDRAMGHGQFEADRFVTPRLISVRVHLGHEVPAQRREMFDRISNLPARGRMVVSVDGESRWVDAELLEVVPDAQQLQGPAFLDVTWRCPDPRKYGELRESISTGSTVQIFHRGGADAWPRFEVTGFPNGYRIIGPGGIAFTVAGPRSGLDVIDFASGEVTRAGVLLAQGITSARRWPVPAGKEVSWRCEAIGSGSGSARLMVDDTWL